MRDPLEHWSLGARIEMPGLACRILGHHQRAERAVAVAAAAAGTVEPTAADTLAPAFPEWTRTVARAAEECSGRLVQLQIPEAAVAAAVVVAVVAVAVAGPSVE